jgi:flagellar basal-body rod modification protein FlgD
VTSPIGNPLGAFATGAAGAAPAGAKPANEMSKDMFLKLLVAQLKYQDPTKPADGTEFLAQTAQFSMVEKLDDLAKSQADMLSAQLMLGASNLVGRTVSYTGADGLEATGVVSSAKFTGSSPTLRVGNTDVPLSSVRDVHN